MLLRHFAPHDASRRSKICLSSFLCHSCIPRSISLGQVANPGFFFLPLQFNSAEPLSIPRVSFASMSTHSIHSTYSASPTPTLGRRESPRVSGLARRIHGWSWQAVSTTTPDRYPNSLLILLQFPVGMGTGAVYLTLSGLKHRPRGLVIVELVFYFLNMVLFFMNTITLIIQAIRTYLSHFSSLLLSFCRSLSPPSVAHRDPPI